MLNYSNILTLSSVSFLCVFSEDPCFYYLIIIVITSSSQAAGFLVFFLLSFIIFHVTRVNISIIIRIITLAPKARAQQKLRSSFGNWSGGSENFQSNEQGITSDFNVAIGRDTLFDSHGRYNSIICPRKLIGQSGRDILVLQQQFFLSSTLNWEIWAVLFLPNIEQLSEELSVNLEAIAFWIRMLKS